jgi:D-3-phosphoglycerate dehydrogenase
VKPLVFVPEQIASAGIDVLRAECDVLAPWMTGRTAEAAMLKDADAVIVRLFKIGEAELDRAPTLKVVAKHGAGVDNIDVAVATRRKLPVLFTPEANANAVAEHTTALMLALAREIAPAARAVIDGRFNARGEFQGVELAGKTLGVVGLGRIGSRVAEIAASGFGMRVIAYDPLLPAGISRPPVRLVDSLDALLGEADFLSLHVPLSQKTRHLIDEKALARMKPGCRIVNTSRGAVIDEAALVEALEAGVVAGAALDVFEVEPLTADHPLCRAQNTLLTPHISSSTGEALRRMATDAAEGVLDVLRGRKPKFLVNPEVLG